MADITDAQVINFHDETLRKLCDAVVGFKALYDAKKIVYTSTVVPAMEDNLDTDLIADGSGPDGDGRTQLDKLDSANAISVIAAIAAVIETGTNEAKITKPHVNLRLP